MPKERLTRSQQNSIHLYFKLVADSLNDAGLTVQETLKHQMEVNWSPLMVKDLIWRQAQKRYTGKQSTTELLKQQEIDDIYEHVSRYLAKLGVEPPPFPDIHQVGGVCNNKACVQCGVRDSV